MKERIAELRGVWRSSPMSAKLAFGMAAATCAYYLVFYTVTMVMGATSGTRFGNLGDPLVLIGLLITGLAGFLMLAAWAVGGQIVIGMSLRARSPRSKWLGTGLAALVTGIVVVGVIQVLTSGETAYEQTGTGAVLEYMLWAPFVVIGAVYAVVAVLGFRDAAGASRHGTSQAA